jgi:hypothetical protein
MGDLIVRGLGSEEPRHLYVPGEVPSILRGVKVVANMGRLGRVMTICVVVRESMCVTAASYTRTGGIAIHMLFGRDLLGFGDLAQVPTLLAQQ